MFVWLTLLIYDFFAVFDLSPLTLCTGIGQICSFITFIFTVLLPDLSRLLIMFINTTFFDFQDVGHLPSWIFCKVWYFNCWSGRFRGPICIIMPTVVPIGQTVRPTEIWPLLNFLRWRPTIYVFNFKFITVRTVKRVELYVTVPNFIETGHPDYIKG